MTPWHRHARSFPGIACASLLLPWAAALTPASTSVAAETAPSAVRKPASKLQLVEFDSSPFPYDGEIPENGKPFLDVVSGDRRGHTSPRGGVYWEDMAYS